MWSRIRLRCATLLGKSIAVAFSNSRSPREYEFATDRSLKPSEWRTLHVEGLLRAASSGCRVDGNHIQLDLTEDDDESCQDRTWITLHEVAEKGKETAAGPAGEVLGHRRRRHAYVMIAKRTRTINHAAINHMTARCIVQQMAKELASGAAKDPGNCRHCLEQGQSAPERIPSWRHQGGSAGVPGLSLGGRPSLPLGSARLVRRLRAALLRPPSARSWMW